MDTKKDGFLQKNEEFKNEIIKIDKSSPLYPEKLKEIFDPPKELYVKGNIPTYGPAVGIVGARMCSEYGRNMANMLGKRLAREGIPVISGMAKGIDSAAHAGTLAGNGITYAVLGCGCDVIYPSSSRNIYNNILKEGGIISEYSPGSQPLAHHFPLRNRIISGLSDILVVVEAKDQSGSLITADAALEQGKDVYAFPARYDDNLGIGCNRLIGQGAGIIWDIEAFIQEINTIFSERYAENERILSKIVNNDDEKKSDNLKNSLEKEEFIVYSVLGFHSKWVNSIIEETGLSLLTVLNSLRGLKDKGLVKETYQNYYCRDSGV